MALSNREKQRRFRVKQKAVKELEALEREMYKDELCKVLERLNNLSSVVDVNINEINELIRRFL